MLKILIVAATAKESAFLVSGKLKKSTPHLISVTATNAFHVDLLITGPGIVATTFGMTKVLENNDYQLAINIGICGSLDKTLRPVKLVNITSDQFGDFGIENNLEFVPAFSTGLFPNQAGIHTKGVLKSTNKLNISSLKAIPKRNGITVQKVHGSTKSAREAFNRFGPVMESMEGAAFFYVANQYRVQSLQIRAISNMVEKRNRKAWKIDDAIDALAGYVSLLLLDLQSLK